MNKLLKGLLGAAVTVAMFGTVNAYAQSSTSSTSGDTSATAQDQAAGATGHSSTKKHSKKKSHHKKSNHSASSGSSSSGSTGSGSSMGSITLSHRPRAPSATGSAAGSPRSPPSATRPTFNTLDFISEDEGNTSGRSKGKGKDKGSLRRDGPS